MAVAQCVETPTEFRRYTVADGTGIARGTILKLTSPSTVEAASSAGDPFGGIAWEEKTANDGITQLTVAVNGIWLIDSTAAAVTVGGLVAVGGANVVVASDSTKLLAGSVVGKSETTVGSGGGKLRVVVGRVI